MFWVNIILFIFQILTKMTIFIFLQGRQTGVVDELSSECMFGILREDI